MAAHIVTTAGQDSQATTNANDSDTNIMLDLEARQLWSLAPMARVL